MIFTTIGAMSGTSCDGIDLGLISTDGVSKIDMLGGAVIPYDKDFARKLLHARNIEKYSDLLMLEKQLTALHASAIISFLKERQIQASQVDYIGFHGQTVFHDPDQGLTLQLGNPHLLSELTGISVVNDFRRRDIAAQGQGAPLVPIFHKALASKLHLDQIVFLNIGGVSNITYIAQDNIIAFDCGPGNALIDDWMMKKNSAQYDQDGKIASAGKISEDIIKKFIADDFIKKPYPKSLDRSHFQYIDVNYLNLEDGAATLTYATAALIKEAIDILPQGIQRVVVCGGGRKNSFLIAILRNILAAEIMDINQLGLDGDLIEAYAFGYLAARTVKNLPISYPNTTGTSAARSGGSITYLTA